MNQNAPPSSERISSRFPRASTSAIGRPSIGVPSSVNTRPPTRSPSIGAPASPPDGSALGGLGAAGASGAKGKALQKAVSAVVDAFDAADAKAARAALKKLDVSLEHSEGHASQVLQLTIGALVEAGAPADAAWPSVARELEAALDGAT